ncbi:MAG: 50S ribosomal protein L15 [Planctomycetales bacterium]
MILDDLRGIHKNRKRKRLGRGPGSGHGKTAGRGHKGFFSRSGAKSREGFEGGQMPLARRIAKRGFNNKQFAAKIAIVNVADLEQKFESGDVVDPDTLREKNLAGGRYDFVKILGNGELTKKLTVRAHRFSRSAEEKIAACGGAVENLVTG